MGDREVSHSHKGIKIQGDRSTRKQRQGDREARNRYREKEIHEDKETETGR